MKVSIREKLFNIILFTGMLPFLMTSCSNNGKSQDKDLLEKALVFLENGEFDQALVTVDQAIEKEGLTDPLLNTKYKILLQSQRYEEALVVFDTIIGREGFIPDVVADKIKLLMKLGRYDEALETSLEVDEVSDGSSPYVSLSISKILIAKEENEKAVDWLEETAGRGFKDYNYLLGNEFESVQSDDRFIAMIEQVKENAGIGTPLKPFSISLFTGGTYNITDDTGKVILIDFWATWCPPCVAENENLIELYAEYKDQGFEIISISADSNRESVEKFLENHKIPWKNGFSGDGRNDNVIGLYKIDSYPTYIVINKKGVVSSISSEGGESLNGIIEANMKD